MGIWDTLSGRSPAKASSATQSATSSSDSSSSSNQAQAFDYSGVQDVQSFLGGEVGFDPASLHPLAGLNQDTLDYLALDDASTLEGGNSALPSRGWSDDLCYGTGVSYLAGLSMGGAWGLAEGLRRTPASAPPKLRLNAVLNACTRRGPFLGGRHSHGV
jgi:import inner membrane translocase subunit TIM23